MTLSTRRAPLAVGATRTFNLSPGVRFDLTTLPNCRVTVTETPNTVSASDAGAIVPGSTDNRPTGRLSPYGTPPDGRQWWWFANASNSGERLVTWGSQDRPWWRPTVHLYPLDQGMGTDFLGAISAAHACAAEAFDPCSISGLHAAGASFSGTASNAKNRGGIRSAINRHQCHGTNNGFAAAASCRPEFTKR